MNNNTVNRIKLSIIIVNWNVRDLLRKCIHSIFLNSRGNLNEIIVIDNASNDGSVEMILNEFSQVKLLVNKENHGFAKACNQAFAIAKGEYFFLLNPDTRVDRLNLDRIAEFMQENSEVAIGGCYVYNPDGSFQESFYRFPTFLNTLGRMFSLFRLLPRNKLTQSFFWSYPHDNVPQNVDRVLGGAMVIRKKTLEDVGQMDENYFLYGEDMDLCYRVQEKGWKISPIPETKVVHFKGESSKKNLEKVIFLRFKNEFIFVKKFYPVIKVMLFRILQFIGAVLRLGFWVLYFLIGYKKQRAKESIKGYLKVFLASWNYN